MRGTKRAKRAISNQLLRSTQVGRDGAAAKILRRALGAQDNRRASYWYTHAPNFGDIISPIITRNLFGVTPVRVHAGFSPKMIGLGSILTAALPGDVVWGSGILDPERFNGRGIEFLAVRGPRSRALIDGDVPERYGDPGILLPMVYTPRKLQSRAQVGLMLHYREKDAYLNTDPGVLSIDVQDPDWRATVDRIASCEVLVSSALHGIIVAEAYGVPAVWIQPTDRHTGGEFKFHDYYEGTDRDARKADFGRGLHGAVERAIPPPVLDASKLLAGCPEPHPHHPSLG